MTETFIQKETEKIAKRIKEQVVIFPSWEGRGLDDKRKEFEAHRGEFTYPMDKIEREIEQEKKALPKNKIFAQADAQMKNLAAEIQTQASDLVGQAFSKGLKKSEDINDRYIQ